MKSKAKKDGMGRPVCLRCGSNLRTSPRKRKKLEKNLTENLFVRISFITSASSEAVVADIA